METIAKNNEVLKLETLTADQIRNENREYNPTEWDNIINRYLKYKNLTFYVARPQRGYSYNRYYAVYEIPEGIILLGSVSYSSCLSNNGFCRVTIGPDGTLRKFFLKDQTGKEGYCVNDKANRRIMAGNSQKVGAIFTTEF